jgi:YkoY family integral membrane protein
MIGAFGMRALVTLLAVYLIEWSWVSLLGGIYLIYLPYRHFTHATVGEQAVRTRKGDAARGFLGLSFFWATVIKVELTDLVFAVDSILVAVALTSKTWVIITGGILGIVMMRLLVLQVLAWVKRYPKLIDGAYLIVLWVGLKLIWEYLHRAHWVSVALPKPVAIGGVIVLLVGSYLYARAHEKRRLAALEAEVAVAEALLRAQLRHEPRNP